MNVCVCKFVINYANMKEWFKKYLGWVGFGVWVAFTLIALLGRFILKIDHYDNLALIGFALWLEFKQFKVFLMKSILPNILKKLKMVLLYLLLLLQL